MFLNKIEFPVQSSHRFHSNFYYYPLLQTCLYKTDIACCRHIYTFPRCTFYTLSAVDLYIVSEMATSQHLYYKQTSARCYFQNNIWQHTIQPALMHIFLLCFGSVAQLSLYCKLSDQNQKVQSPLEITASIFIDIYFQQMAIYYFSKTGQHSQAIML